MARENVVRAKMKFLVLDFSRFFVKNHDTWRQKALWLKDPEDLHQNQLQDHQNHPQDHQNHLQDHQNHTYKDPPNGVVLIQVILMVLEVVLVLLRVVLVVLELVLM